MYRRYTTLSGKHLNCWYNALGGIEASKNPKTEEDRRFIFRQYFLETLLCDTETVGIIGKFKH